MEEIFVPIYPSAKDKSDLQDTFQLCLMNLWILINENGWESLSQVSKWPQWKLTICSCIHTRTIKRAEVPLPSREEQWKQLTEPKALWYQQCWKQIHAYLYAENTNIFGWQKLLKNIKLSFISLYFFSWQCLN